MSYRGVLVLFYNNWVESFSWVGLAGLGALIFLGGFVDALAGGGGLITLPAYLASGLDPSLLLGTNKLSSSIGTVASTLRYKRSGGFLLRPFIPAIAASLIGSAAGARLAADVNPDWIRPLLLGALPVAALLVLTKKHFGAEDRSASLGSRGLLVRHLAVAFPIGCYDGFFGPGTGTFFALALSRFCRYDLVKATAGAKVLNLTSNMSALFVFAALDRAQLGLGCAMGVLSVAGHYAGSGLGIRQGARVIRPMLALVCSGLFVKILFDLATEP